MRVAAIAAGRESDAIFAPLLIFAGLTVVTERINWFKDHVACPTLHASSLFYQIFYESLEKIFFRKTWNFYNFLLNY